MFPILHSLCLWFFFFFFKQMHSDIMPPEMFSQHRPLSLNLSVNFNYDLVFFFPSWSHNLEVLKTSYNNNWNCANNNCSVFSGQEKLSQATYDNLLLVQRF